MTENEYRGDGWTEYRLLVTVMLERHDEAIDEIAQRLPQERENCNMRIASVEGRLRDLVDEKFVQLGEMSKRQVEIAKDELKKESTEVSVAKITGQWQFWVAIAIQIGTIVVALIALNK